MANILIKTDTLRREIEALLREYPDLKDDDTLRADMIEGSTDFRAVLTALANRYDNTRGDYDGCAKRLEEMNSRLARYADRISFLRELMLRLLLDADQTKVELPVATLSTKRNPPRLVGDVDPALLQDDLCKITRSPDKMKIREAIERGGIVPGFALSNSPPGLVVRVK